MIHEVNREVRCIGTKYSVKMKPMYFEWEKFIPTLEKHFQDILEVYESMMHEVNREVRCIGTRYSVKMEPMYFEWDKFIPTLEKHFQDILEEILNCDHQRHDYE